MLTRLQVQAVIGGPLSDPAPVPQALPDGVAEVKVDVMGLPSWLQVEQRALRIDEVA
jgi:hypothetical protein